MELFEEFNYSDSSLQSNRRVERVSNLMDMFSDYSFHLLPEPCHDESDIFGSLGGRPPNLARIRVEYPHTRVSAGYGPAFTLLELSSLLRKDLTVANFDTGKILLIDSFEGLRECYLKHSLKLGQLRRQLYTPNDYALEKQGFTFLEAVISKMLEAHPVESLSYALSDVYTVDRLRKNGDQRFTSFRGSVTSIPTDAPGVIFLARFAPDRDHLLSTKLLTGCLTSSEIKYSGGSFNTINIELTPKDQLSRLGGVFVPTKNVKASSDLLLMVAQNFFSEGEESDDYVDSEYKSLIERSFFTALKSHKALE